MKQHKMLLFAMIAMFGILLAACQSQVVTQEAEVEVEQAAAVEQEAAVQELFFAFDVDNLDEATNTHTQAAIARIEEINAERDDVNITYEVTDAQNNIENQISSMESWLLKKPDVILFTYVDAEAAKPLVKTLRDEGIKIVDIRNLGDPDLVDVVYYGNDEPTFAGMMTEWLEGYLQDNPDVVLNTGLIYGLATQTPQLIRIDLVKDLAEKHPDRINILVEAHGDWDPAKAQNITEDWLQAFPDMNYIHVGNTGMAGGVATALEGANKTDDFLVAANDLSDSAIQMLFDGQIDAVTGALFSDFGRGYIDAAMALQDGTLTEKEWRKVIPYAVDASNLEDFLENKWDGKQPEGEAAVEQEAAVQELFFAFDVDNLDEATNTHTQAAIARIEEINAERDDVNITYEVTDAQNNIENQISSMESWLLKKPDVILFTYVDAEAAKPLVKTLRDEGIKVVDIRNLGDPDLVDVVYYGNDEPTFAGMMTEWLEGYLQDNPDVVLNTGLIYGLATQTPQLIRIDLVKDLAEKHPDRINILVEAHGDWDPAKAQNITEDWLQAFPDMNYIHVGNTGMAGGVATALEGANKTDDFLVAANDLSDSAIQMLFDGQIDVVTGALFSDFGRGYIDAAMALQDGTLTEKEWRKVIPYAVDASNLEDFLENKWDGKQPE